MRAAADSTPTGDSLRLAVLAALNIADELFRCRDSNHVRDGRLAERAEELEKILDRVLTISVGRAQPAPVTPHLASTPSRLRSLKRLSSLLCA